jgi:N-acyl-phosphatidylethanolamine-hydrolysing phospholipase D
LVGHASALIQFPGFNLLTDPVWSDRASPLRWTGPKRARPPAIEFKNLPPIDCVLVSHNHYDHLDEDSVLELNQKFGQNLSWFVPMGIKSWFTSNKIIKNVYELNWWETIKNDNFEIVFTPAQHWSGRGLFDRFEVMIDISIHLFEYLIRKIFH